MQSIVPILLASLLALAGVTGLSPDILDQYVDPTLWAIWIPLRFGPLLLAFVYLAILRRRQSPLMDAFFILPAIITCLFLEYLSLAPQIPWLIGLPLSYQAWAPLLWLGVTASLCASYLRSSAETTQPLDYARRSLLSLTVLCLIGIWLLPTMGDTLLARSERWIEAFQVNRLQDGFPYQSEITFWLETGGIAFALLLFLVQTAFFRRSKTQHRVALLVTLCGILFWSGLRSYDGHDSFALLTLNIRESLVFTMTSIIAARTAGFALLYWHLPIPNRPLHHPPSIRTELLAARMRYAEPRVEKPALRKGVKRLVDRCHRALEKEAKAKGVSPAIWIPHRLEAGIESSSPCPAHPPEGLNQARALDHYLARGRRLEVIFCTWILLLGLGWSEWRANTPYLPPSIANHSIFNAEHLWRSGLRTGLINRLPPQTSPQKLAKNLAAQMQQDVIWKLQQIEDNTGISNPETIFQTLSKCGEQHTLERPLDCQNTHLLEPLILTVLDTLEEAEKTHIKELSPTFRAPQIIRDLLPNHPDVSALDISKIMAGQLAAFDERFMARTALFAMVLAAHEAPKSKHGRAANLALNLLAPPDVLLSRLNEDTRRLSARALGLYTVIFGSPPYYRGQENPEPNEQKGAQDP